MIFIKKIINDNNIHFFLKKTSNNNVNLKNH